MSSKIREALSKASIALSWASHHHLTEDDAKECLEVVDAALAEPVRNCDVGTAEEQGVRFEAYCDNEVCNRKNCGCSCKVFYIDGCALEWAQMPYEEGVTDEQ